MKDVEVTDNPDVPRARYRDNRTCQMQRRDEALNTSWLASKETSPTLVRRACKHGQRQSEDDSDCSLTVSISNITYNTKNTKI